jgi:hypothetical protein
MHWVYTPGQGVVHAQNIPEIVLLQTHYSKYSSIFYKYTTNILFPETHILFHSLPIPFSYYMLHRHIHYSIQHHPLQHVLLSFYTLLQPYLLSSMPAAPSHRLSPFLPATEGKLSLARRLLDPVFFYPELRSARGSLRLCLMEDVQGEWGIPSSSPITWRGMFSHMSKSSSSKFSRGETGGAVGGAVERAVVVAVEGAVGGAGVGAAGGPEGLLEGCAPSAVSTCTTSNIDDTSPIFQHISLSLPAHLAG